MRIWQDVRGGVKGLLRGRGVTGLAVLAFALGIGVTTAVFSLFYGVLLKPLPYPEPDALVMVYDTQPACSTCPASLPKYVDWQTRNTVLEAIGGSTTGIAVITGGGDPERVSAVSATASLVNDVFRVSPRLGRWFSEDEDEFGGPKVVVLSFDFWQRRFGGAGDIVGQSMVIGGESYEVIGVMPDTFAHRRGDIFLPLQREVDPATRGSHFLVTYGRLKPGVTVERAQTEMIALGRQLAEEFGHNHGIDVRSYYRAVVGNVEGPLRVLMGGVALVLLIAAANVANLLLASGLARRRELAVRAALGATRWDLARLLTAESVVLAMAGGLLGLLVAQWAISTFVALAAGVLPRTTTIAIDGWVVLFAMAVSLVTGILCGLWPVLRLGARTLAHDVREGDQRTGASGRRVGNGLVVVEIAVAFSLLVGAGLLIKSLTGLEARDTGFDPDGVVAFDVAPTGTRYAEEGQVSAFYRDLLPRLAALPGVTGAGVTSHLPMYAYGWNGEVVLEDGNPWADNEAPLVEYRWVGGDYFQTMGIALRRGRLFGPEDGEGAPLKAVLSETTAEKFWPGENPLGRRFTKGDPVPGNPVWEVIGVVADVRSRGLNSTTPYEMYASIEQQTFGAMTVVLRTAGANPASIMPSARAAVAEVDAQLPVSQVQTLTQVVSESVSRPRLLAALGALFGVLAGLLAAVGVYGVMAYNVRRERRELGVRLALGADPGRLRRMVVLRGMTLGLIGVAIGGTAAYWLTRTVESMLADVDPTDPEVFAATAVLLVVIAVAAVYWPARQASKTDPMQVLKT